jgi:sn-glycerol 3-phosphate transport system ATP-binding protein
VSGTVASSEYHGADTILTVRVGDEVLLVRAPGQLVRPSGAAARLAWKPESLHVFDAATGVRVAEERQPHRLAAAAG